MLWSPQFDDVEWHWDGEEWKDKDGQGWPGMLVDGLVYRCIGVEEQENEVRWGKQGENVHKVMDEISNKNLQKQ